jgi:hypothetical protein
MNNENNLRYGIGLSHLWGSLISYILKDIVIKNGLTISDESMQILEDISKNMPDVKTMDSLKEKAIEESKTNNTIQKVATVPSLIASNIPPIIN